MRGVIVVLHSILLPLIPGLLTEDAVSFLILSRLNLNGDGVEAVLLKQGLSNISQNLLAVRCVCYRQQAENNQNAYNIILERRASVYWQKLFTNF